MFASPNLVQTTFTATPIHHYYSKLQTYHFQTVISITDIVEILQWADQRLLIHYFPKVCTAQYPNATKQLKQFKDGNLGICLYVLTLTNHKEGFLINLTTIIE